MYGNNRLFGSCDPREQTGQLGEGGISPFINSHIPGYSVPSYPVPNQSYHFQHHRPREIGDVHDGSCKPGAKRLKETDAIQYLNQARDPPSNPALKQNNKHIFRF
jgi:hypothetical protein